MIRSVSCQLVIQCIIKLDIKAYNLQSLNIHDAYMLWVLTINEACIGYFGKRDIGLFFKGYWVIGFFFFFFCLFFFFFDMGYSGILGYGILEFILGYKLN